MSPATSEDKGPGQAAGFDDLAVEANSLEGGPPPPGTPEAARVESEDLAQMTAELMQALELARLMVSPMFRWWQEFPQVWSDQALKGIAKGGAAVMQRHGWTVAELFAKYAPYIALAGATIPPCIVTHQAIKGYTAHLAQQRKERAAAPSEPAEGAAHGSDSKATH